MIPIFTVVTRPDVQEGARVIENNTQTTTETQPARKDEPLLTPAEVTIYSLVGFGSLILLLLIVVLWFRSKTRGTEMSLVNQEHEFEREMLKEFESLKSAVGSSKTMAAATDGYDAQPIGPGATSPVPAFAAATAIGATPLMDAGAAGGFDALAESVCARLEAAGLLQSREGPFRLGDSDSQGQMVRLRGDRLALIIGDWESEKFYQRQLKRFDVIFIARSADSVTVVQNLPRYLGDRVTM